MWGAATDTVNPKWVSTVRQDHPMDECCRLSGKLFKGTGCAVRNRPHTRSPPGPNMRGSDRRLRKR